MTEKNRYPQIPSTVWWGFRGILTRTPNTTVDERLLGIELGVQEAAARQYVVELKLVGLLNEDSKATPLALKWRLETGYAEAVQELAEKIYPQGLRDLAPPGNADRQRVVSWFLHEGLGQGAAGNKAATYLMITSATPNEAPARASASRSDDAGKKASSTKAQKAPTQRSAIEQRARRPAERSTGPGPENFPLNVNVQIHISADAGSEQIESIFSAMRRYLYDNQSH
jgi:hypothetical protein